MRHALTQYLGLTSSSTVKTTIFCVYLLEDNSKTKHSIILQVRKNIEMHNKYTYYLKNGENGSITDKIFIQNVGKANFFPILETCYIFLFCKTSLRIIVSFL